MDGLNWQNEEKNKQEKEEKEIKKNKKGQKEEGREDEGQSNNQKDKRKGKSTQTNKKEEEERRKWRNLARKHGKKQPCFPDMCRTPDLHVMAFQNCCGGANSTQEKTNQTKKARHTKQSGEGKKR